MSPGFDLIGSCNPAPCGYITLSGFVFLFGRWVCGCYAVDGRARQVACHGRNSTLASSKDVREFEQAEIAGLGIARVGQRVRHPKFGLGVIECFYVYDDGTTTVRVKFRGLLGSKVLLPEHAKLKAPRKWWPW